MFLYGKNSIIERLKVAPNTIRSIFIEDKFSDQPILELIKLKNVPMKYISSQRLKSAIHTDRNLQGVIAEVDNFVYADFDDLLFNSDKKLSFIFLDRITDPQNLGAILRITACFGRFVIVIPKHKACEINETVLHIAAGGENYTPVCLVSNLSNALIEAKKQGYWLVGAVCGKADDIQKVGLPFPLCLVLGSEGEGVRYGVDKHLEFRIKVPMPGADLSLNVATACTIFCYEISRQRK